MVWNETIGLGCPQLPPTRSGNFSSAACTWSTDAGHYRLLQEVAYANAEGAGWMTTCALMLVYPLTICLQMLLVEATAKHLSPTLGRLISEGVAPVLPLTFAFSTPQCVWSALANLCCVCVALTAVRAEPVAWLPLWMRLRAMRVARREGGNPRGFSRIEPTGSRLRFIGEFRAVVMLSTCIVILSVDFPAVFPRAHAKTEAYGFSLMDLGTGCIVFSSAICSRAARGVGHEAWRPLAVLKKIVALWPILAIGLVRLAVLSGMDYYVPTSEYGVHWNFFLTIAVVAVGSTAADLRPVASAVAGAVLLFGYQVFLSAGGGAEYILTAPRAGLFSANREGVLSCIGYLGIHWLSVAIGSFVANPLSSPYRVARGLLLLAAAGVGTAVALSMAGLPASHRMCNLPYAAFVLGIDALVLGLLAMVDLYWPWPRPPLPLVYGGVQDSMLVAFLLANLLTGAVNMLVQPLLMPCGAALAVMSLYSLLWAAPFGALRSAGVALKFW